MIPPKPYVREDPSGAFRVGTTKVSLDSVVYAFDEGHSPESIMEQYPALTLEEIYGAIAFYLANREEVRQYLSRQERLWEELRRKADENPSPVVQRLRALRSRKARQGKP